MKIRSIIISLLFFVSLFANSVKRPIEIIYIHPVPNSKYVTVQTNVILRLDEKFKSQLNQSSVQFEVIGSKSGYHAGKIIISGNSVLFQPEKDFEPAEKVNISVSSSLLGQGNSFSFSFETNSIRKFDLKVFRSISDDNNLLSLSKTSSEPKVFGKPTVKNGVTVPSDFPQYNVNTLDEASNSKIFMGIWNHSDDKHYIMILENDGTPYFYKRIPGAQSKDFKLQPTGTLTQRIYENLNCFVEMDSQYVNIDTLCCGNGLSTDEHDLQLLPNHHYFLIGLDYRKVDLSNVISGGDTNATVIGNTVQELDENHNVIFEWRSWDNFEITDAIHEYLAGNTIDYVHMNSIAIDYDDNIIISSRHLSEVTKIDRNTGEIIWRLGGIHNQFTFVNDEYGISYQHDVRPVPGRQNSYTMMDNGVYHSPNFSRAVEFYLDTNAMTATKMWEYRHSPDYYTEFMGSVQRLQNGNTFINWADAPLPKAFEVTPSGDILYKANFENDSYSYRSYRFDWESIVKVPYLILESFNDRITLIFNKFGDKYVKRYIVYGGTSPNPNTPVDSTTQTRIDLTDLVNHQTYYFRVTARDSNDVESPYSNEENVFVKFVEPGQNLIVNGDFSDSSAYWHFNTNNEAQALGSVLNGEFLVEVQSGGSQYSDVQLRQESFPLNKAKRYIFEFDARADANRIIEPRIEKNGGNYTVYSKIGPIVIRPQWKHFSYQFEMTDPNDNDARVVLNCGNSNIACYFDNVSVKEYVVVPVELTSFSGSVIEKSVILNWSTATELNNYGFEIQRKVIGGDFVAVEFINGNGTATQQNKYSFADKNLANGKYFYRLKQMDYDGNYTYSQTIEVVVKSPLKYTLEQNYPNPFNPKTTIGFSLKEKGNVKLSIQNILGEEVSLLLNEEKESGYHSVDFFANELPTGVYFYRIEAGPFIQTRKLLLLK